MSQEDERRKNDAVASSVSSSEFADLNPDKLESPIDLNIAVMTVKKIKPLHWCHYKVPPKKLKLTNTGKTVVLSAKWNQERPFVAGGPFSSRFVFSQVHFHWGRNDMQGSEHSVDGGRSPDIHLPMELHAVHFKSDYLSQEVAMRETDGIAIIVYFFKSVENPKMNRIVETLPFLQQAHSSSRIVPWPMTELLRTFADDYFLYRGWISTRNYGHSILWLISREPIGISVEQVAAFRTLKATNLQPLGRDSRVLHERGNRRVYHVNPSGSMYASLLPIPHGPSPSGSESTSARACLERDTDRTGDLEETTSRL